VLHSRYKREQAIVSLDHSRDFQKSRSQDRRLELALSDEYSWSSRNYLPFVQVADRISELLQRRARSFSSTIAILRRDARREKGRREERRGMCAHKDSSGFSSLRSARWTNMLTTPARLISLLSGTALSSRTRRKTDRSRNYNRGLVTREESARKTYFLRDRETS